MSLNFERVTVEEFLRARDEFPGVVATECWFTPELPGRRVCAGCALTVVGLVRKYYTLEQLIEHYEKHHHPNFAYYQWNQRTDRYYVNGFVGGFDDHDPEGDDAPVDPCDETLVVDTGAYDGARCRVALYNAITAGAEE